MRPRPINKRASPFLSDSNSPEHAGWNLKDGKWRWHLGKEVVQRTWSRDLPAVTIQLAQLAPWPFL